IDRSAPFVAQQIQDRRDKGAGVSNTDPEHEIRDGPGPANGNLVSPGADARGDQISNPKQSETRDAGCNSETDPPTARSRLLYNTGNAFGQPVEITPIQN